jgi:hypothetical protein
LYGHRYEKRHEEEYTTRKSYYFFRCKRSLVSRKLRYLTFVREKAHDRGDGTANHDEQIDDEDDMQNLILP